MRRRDVVCFNIPVCDHSNLDHERHRILAVEGEEALDREQPMRLPWLHPGGTRLAQPS